MLANDTGTGLSVTGHTSPTHGAVAINPDGSYTYTPAAGYSGADSFTYTVTDAAAQTATATVHLTVSPPAAPVATDDNGTTAFETPLVVAAPGVLANDTGTGLSVTGHTSPTHGAVAINPDGSYTYTPAAGYSGADSFTYTVTDAAAQTATATVHLTVSPPAAPVATDDNGTTAFETPLVVAAPGVLANDTGTGLSVTGHTSPTHGAVAINPDGSYTYTPAAGYSGADSFTYTVTDAAAQTATATVHLTVSPPAPPAPTPVVLGIFPAVGPPAGGEFVLIYGRNLCGATTVTFGAVSAGIRSIDRDCSTIVVTEPPGRGIARVVVTTPGGSAASPVSFTYLEPKHPETECDDKIFPFGGALSFGWPPGALNPAAWLNAPLVATAGSPDHEGYGLCDDGDRSMG